LLFVRTVGRVLVSVILLLGGMMAIGQEQSTPDALSTSQTQSGSSSVVSSGVVQSVPRREQSKNHVFSTIPDYCRTKTRRKSFGKYGKQVGPTNSLGYVLQRGKRVVAGHPQQNVQALGFTLALWIVAEGQRTARSDKADYVTKTSDRD
jgi:hypothetical protein